MSKNNIVNSGTFEKQEQRNRVVEKIRDLSSQDFRRFRNKLGGKFRNGAVTKTLSDVNQIRENHLSGFRREHADEAYQKCEEALCELGL